MQTPLVYGDLLYVCRDNGVLSVYDARTGQRHYQARLADGKTGFTRVGRCRERPHLLTRAKKATST